MISLIIWSFKFRMFSSEPPWNMGSIFRSLARRWIAISTRHGRFNSSMIRSSINTADISVIPCSTRAVESNWPTLVPWPLSALGSLMISIKLSKCSGVISFLTAKLTSALRLKYSVNLGRNNSAIPVPTSVRTLTGSSRIPLIRISTFSRVSCLMISICLDSPRQFWNLSYKPRLASSEPGWSEA